MSDKMNPGIKARWVAALRSGRYKKGKHCLRDKDNNFCCLGVLADIYLKEKNKDWVFQDRIGIYAYRGSGSLLRDRTLGKDISEWAGLYCTLTTEGYLININDSPDKTTFEEIASIIENNF